MISAKELRIGNLVLYNCKVISISPEGLRELYYIEDSFAKSKNDKRDYLPIPLTPEILEKCGFIKDRSTMSLLGGYIIWFERIEDRLFLCTDESSKQILFLHDFQNIYFALNGEELEINL